MMSNTGYLDMRGTWMSEGDTYINCTLDGRDGYDLVEWIAEKEWSNKW
jgi:predicted acyl esterase